MNHILSSFRRVFFWTYARNTWQWDVLCVLILIFIFLTPKNWFANRPAGGGIMLPARAVSTVLLGPETVVDTEDRAQLAQRVRAISGRADIEVVEVRKRQDRDGTILGYEVDIR